MVGVEQVFGDLLVDGIQQLWCIGGQWVQEQLVQVFVVDFGQFVWGLGVQDDFVLV